MLPSNLLAHCLSTDKERCKILEFFGTVDPAKNHHTAVKLRQPGTGVWFTDGQDFMNWVGTRNARLWLYGIREFRSILMTVWEIHPVSDQESLRDMADRYGSHSRSRKDYLNVSIDAIAIILILSGGSYQL